MNGPKSEVELGREHRTVEKQFIKCLLIIAHLSGAEIQMYKMQTGSHILGEKNRTTWY